MKGAWWQSRTVWAAILLGAAQVVAVVPFPQAALVSAICNTVAGLLAANKVREIAGDLKTP